VVDVGGGVVTDVLGSTGGSSSVGFVVVVSWVVVEVVCGNAVDGVVVSIGTKAVDDVVVVAGSVVVVLVVVVVVVVVSVVVVISA